MQGLVCCAHLTALDYGDSSLCGLTLRLLNTAQTLDECDALHYRLAARGDVAIIRAHKDAARVNKADTCRLVSKAAANSFEVGAQVILAEVHCLYF